MIDDLLDEDGRGKLTPTLKELFTVNGCEPMCHICHKPIAVNFDFRLKPFIREKKARDGHQTTGNVMVCQPCDVTEKPLPYPEFQKMCVELKIGKFYKDYYNSKFDSEHVEDAQASKNLQKWDILFNYESYGEWKKRMDERDRREAARNSGRRGGCFLISTGKGERIIGVK